MSKQPVEGDAWRSNSWDSDPWRAGCGHCLTIEDRPSQSSRDHLRCENAELIVNEHQLRKPTDSCQEYSAGASFDQLTPQKAVDTAVERYCNDMILSRAIAGC